MPHRVTIRLRSGKLVSDRLFDEVYPDTLRFVSHQHWTPVKVAARAARLLVEAGATSILDVGAGAGKFCLVGALTTQQQFIGIEQRGHLVDAARLAARRLGVGRALFLRGNVTSLDVEPFDGFYLFNPFYEQVCGSLLPIDDTIELSPLLFRKYVLAVIGKLACARLGTAVVTYHGFGGKMPPGYRRVCQESAGGAELVLWQKVDSTAHTKTDTAAGDAVASREATGRNAITRSPRPPA